MHVIERTDRFTLVGADARRGKLTLFDAEGPRERGALKHVALRVNDLEPRWPSFRTSSSGARDGAVYFDAPRASARARRGGDRRRVRPRPRRALLGRPGGDRGRVPRLGFAAATPGRRRAARRGRRRVRRVPPGRPRRARAAAAQPPGRPRRLGRGAPPRRRSAASRSHDVVDAPNTLRRVRLGPGARQARVRRAQADVLAD